VAVYNRTAAGNTMSYMLEDHQGGISNIASNSGASDVNESFSAFGARRNPTTWSGAPTTADLNTIASLSRQGYTMQTWLGQSMGLNHMNGRVEDAILGRFLSPDPHITDPTNAQNYNRYSYVLNNPLTFRDPTGFDCVTDGDGFTTCTVGSGGSGASAAPGNGFGPSISGPPALNLPTRTPGVPGQTATTDPNGMQTITVTASNGYSDGTATPGVLGQYYNPSGFSGLPTITAIGSASQASVDFMAQSPTQNSPCVNLISRVGQGAVGLGQVLAGGAQAIEGAGQTLFGVGGALESGGATLLAVPGGLLNLTLGSTAVIDGGALLQAAINGNGNPQSVFGQVGQTYAGENGSLAGEAVNLAAAVAAIATGNQQARQLNLALTLAQSAVSVACGSE
jgi:RHS repeat-associated protein